MFRYDRQGPLGRITLANPPYNALVHPAFTDLEELTGFLEEPSLKGVILEGEGKHFSSGADPDSFAELFGDREALAGALNQGKKLIQALSFAPVPIAALIRGSCLGGGFEIALGCHFRFSSRNAMLGFPESSHGLIPGLGGTFFAGKILENHHLLDLVFSARMIRAEEALQMGLINQVAASGDIEQQTVSFIERLTADHSPTLIHSLMQAVHNGRLLPLREALREETRLFCGLAEVAAASSVQKDGATDE